jgi:hypothetical protein
MKYVIFEKHARRLLKVAQDCTDPKLRDRLIAMADEWIEDANETHCHAEQATGRRH